MRGPVTGNGPDAWDDGEPGEEALLEIPLSVEEAAGRLDKALADRLPFLSRARLQALIEAGALTFDGKVLESGKAPARSGLYMLRLPPAEPAEPEPERLDLMILFEDEDLIVVDKPAGMATHPAPGSPSGTLVNALLHHCAGSLSGIGGVARPGIVHRLDKDTTGVMVAAKSDRAHAGLVDLFARRDLERRYVAFVRGVPEPPQGEIDAPIGRSASDRKKMAVRRAGGREAQTLYATVARFGPADRAVAARLDVRLKTGRTHQIRVHMASIGRPCLGDPVYGSGRPGAALAQAVAASALARQALHAQVLGFIHPVTGVALRFEAALPDDLERLQAALSAL